MVRTFNLLAIIIIVNFLAKKYYFRINFDFMVNSAMVVRWINSLAINAVIQEAFLSWIVINKLINLFI